MTDEPNYKELLRLSDMQIEMKNDIIKCLHELKDMYYKENQELKRRMDNLSKIPCPGCGGFIGPFVLMKEAGVLNDD